MSPGSEYEGERSRDGWDEHWRGIPLPTALRPWTPVIRAYDRFFRRCAGDLRGRRILEIGCCPGRWMAYFASRYEARVAGIEYAERSCELTRRNLALQEIEAPCYQGDARDVELDAGTYDLVFSMGVVEHYDDPREMLAAHARFTEPGGCVVVTCPNLAGLHGAIMRRFSPTAWSEHVPHTLDLLQRAGRDVGLEPCCARPLGGLDPMMATGRKGPGAQALFAVPVVLSNLLPIDSEAVSAYLAVGYRKPAGTGRAG